MRLWVFRFTIVLRYIAVSVFLMVGLAVFAQFKVALSLSVSFAIFLGIEMALYRIWKTSRKRFSPPFIFQLLIELAVLQVLIVVAILVIDQFVDLSRYPQIGSLNWRNFLSDTHLFFYFRAILFAIGLIFLFEIQDILGRNYIWHYLTGKYRKPTRERRLLVFMDLVDSTTIAEKLGTVLFYNFINDCFASLTSPAVEHKASILKYVGDEVILSWKVNQHSPVQDAFAFVEQFYQAMQDRSAYFESEYGTIPVFRSALHEDEVIAAYVGNLKKQFDLNGDGMNTTSRMCGLAKSLNANVVISKELFQKLPPISYSTVEHPAVHLLGRMEPIDLVSFTI